MLIQYFQQYLKSGFIYYVEGHHMFPYKHGYCLNSLVFVYCGCHQYLSYLASCLLLELFSSAFTHLLCKFHMKPVGMVSAPL